MPVTAAALTWTDAPLCGRLLVEASAGTGKTWTISALYLRLLLESPDGAAALTPERIVVATFTDAAAQELGERLRSRINEALQAARDGIALPGATTATPVSNDPVLGWLASRWLDDAQCGRDRDRLVAALAQLDRAPIGTLHGLCHRLLLDHPLEGGLGFAPPRLSNGRRVHEALARDLLRRIGAGGLPARAMDLPKSATRFGDLVGSIAFMLQPGVVVSPTPSTAELRAALDPVQATLRTLLIKDGHYSHSSNAVLNSTKAAVDFLDAGPVPKSLAKLLDPAEIHKDRVLEAARAKVLDPVFQASIQRFETLRERLHSPERAFWAYWAPELRRLRESRSAELHELGFDPLIERVRDAMLRIDSPLPDAAFARWPVALVDEFQDTDGTQYALLDRWYRDASGTARGLLAMVGDPKQAIYGFRGGDVHAYLAAREQADATLRLAVNQRSSSAYVAACNAFFDGSRATLSSLPGHRIRYESVSPAGRADALRLHEDGKPLERPLLLHELQAALPNVVARPQAIEACAELVSQWLGSGRYTLGDPALNVKARALAAGDIAVLLRTHAELDALRHALQARGVACAGQAREQVFDSPTARDLLLVLHALLHPGDTGALRATLLTALFRVPLSTLPVLEADGGLDAWRERCLGWRQQWMNEGVLAAVLALLEAAGPTLATNPDRERMVTDMRHLGELLQAREAEGHGAPALLDWLRAQRLGEDDASLEHGERRLRLESDAKRVRLMTLHASKGLEFPVVLLPTLWGHEDLTSNRALAPSEHDGQREVLFESNALKNLAVEQQEERFRLLYVALTRAMQACHVFALPFDRPAKKAAKNAASKPKPKSDPERSALDALLARWPEGKRDSSHIDWREGWPVSTPSGSNMLSNTAQHAVSEAHCIESERDAPISPPPPGPFRLPMRWSFSRLSKGHDRSSVEAAAADDETPPSDTLLIDAPHLDARANDAPALDLPMLDSATRMRVNAALAELAEVGDTVFGNALHELLDDFAPGRRFIDDIAPVQAALTRHAVRIKGTTPMAMIAQRVAVMLDRVLSAPLALGSAPLRLGLLTRSQRRSELAFHFQLRDASLRALREACERHGEPDLVPPGTSDRLSGWMEGSIDLVFEHGGRAHVLDWKSNALADADAATPAALVAPMNHHHYRFQALLYTVVLHRLLRQRLGAAYRIEAQLGAPIYLFLRAAGLAPELGVWTQRFPNALVEAVDAALAGERP